MQYRIVNLRLKNFKCFDNAKYYEFCIDYEKNPIILSGPNGFGKTTFFDAVELIFSKNITRLDKGIEKKNTNLGKNILLNRANEDGYVVLTLRNEHDEFLTLFAKILNSNHKLEVENAINYGEVREFISTDKLDEFLYGYREWKNEIDNEKLIKYRSNNFNVYYYVSQAESVHFLKRTISDRKNAMNVLLNTGFIDERRKVVVDLIGSRNGISGHPFNDEILSLENKLSEKIRELKELTKNNVHAGNKNAKFVDFGLYQKDTEVFFWDNPNISKLNVSEIKKAKKSLNSLISFIENESDYRNYCWNTDISKILQSKSVEDYVNQKKYIFNNLVSVENVQKELDKWDLQIQIYNYSLLFRQDVPDATKYKDEYIVKLKELIPELGQFDFSLIKNISSEIISLKNTLSSNQKIIERLASARIELKNAKEEYDKQGAICPFCNTKFKSVDILNDGFKDVDRLLKDESGSIGERIELKNAELMSAIAIVKEIIYPYVNGLDETSVKLLIQQKTSLEEFINDSGRVTNVEKLEKYLANTDFNSKLEDDNMIIEIQRVLSELVRKIKNEDFNDLYIEHGYKNIEKAYGDTISYIKEQISEEALKQKRDCLETIIWEKENTKIHSLKDDVRKIIIRKEKVTNVRKRLNELNKVYDKEVEEYKNMTLKKLRVPLLIYTGKILQDYQNGLGVFVSKDEMRFVSNGDAKHDILNTFSSGQLSGFVLAFLFAMNKQYIKESADDIGFILIDDPVQTMDDINISSLIEVLRNDFLNKQIILSTHEMDKENYILYKFFKYSQVGQSFNVKEEIYEV